MRLGNKKKIMLLTAVSISILMPTPSKSDGTFYSSYPAPRKTSKDWDITLGLGEGYGPRYEGSDDKTFSLVPYFEIIWQDRLTLDPRGLDYAIIHNDKYDLGLGIAYDGGRDQKSNNNPFSTSDDKLNGMGNIEPSLGARVFASYSIEPLELHTSVTKFAIPQNEGVLANFGSSINIPITQKFIATPKVELTWADSRYMQTYFGVNEVQASRTQFHQFNASAGFKDIETGVNFSYMLDDNQNWFLSQDINFKQLLGNIQRSPVVQSNNSITLVSMLGYHF